MSVHELQSVSFPVNTDWQNVQKMCEKSVQAPEILCCVVYNLDPKE